jgi:hypothetical protein
MITRKIKHKKYKIYESEEEFRKDYPDEKIYTNWREGTEGSWVKTDDGRVCPVLHRGELRNGTVEGVYNYYIRTPIGSFVCRDGIVMDGEPRKNIYSFGSGDKSPYEIKRDRKKPTKREFLFAKYVAKGDDIVDAFLSAYPTENRDYAESQAKILMNTERVRGLIREEIDKVLNEAEITPLYILNKMKNIIESPDGKDSDKVSILKELVTISGMKDTEKRSESVTVFQGFSQEQLSAIGGEDTKKLAEAKREIEK